MQPLNDRVLIRRIEEPEQRIGGIIVPQIAKEKAIKGVIVAVGQGKWHPGEWWNVRTRSFTNPDTGEDGCMEREYYTWQWIEGYREVPSVYPGQTVYFNSKWDDSNGQIAADLHLVQEADIFVVIH